MALTHLTFIVDTFPKLPSNTKFWIALVQNCETTHKIGVLPTQRGGRSVQDSQRKQYLGT